MATAQKAKQTVISSQAGHVDTASLQYDERVTYAAWDGIIASQPTAGMLQGLQTCGQNSAAAVRALRPPGARSRLPARARRILTARSPGPLWRTT